MTWTYSSDPTNSDLDAVRFYVQDTDATEQLISDEEINFLLATWMPLYFSPLYVAAVCAEFIANKFARELTYSADGVSIQGGDLQDKYNAMAANLRDQYKSYQTVQGGGPDVGGILYGETLDPSIRPLVFAQGMNDNPRAGFQDTGGSGPAPPANLPNDSGLVTG